ncbi:MAG: TAXI family TRAP transporter solute-binding subunit [Lysobacterales bacterium]
MNRPLLGSSALAVALAVGGFLLAYQFVEPAPPKRVVMATGGVDGAYQQFGLAMKKELADNGIELVLKTTAGSRENAQLLASGSVDLALMQGGTEMSDTEDMQVRALASLYFEALWIFLRDGLPAEQLGDLAALRVDHGAEGSGTRTLVDELFQLNGIDISAMDNFASENSAALLNNGQLDAVMTVAGESSPKVRQMLEMPNVALMHLPRASAYPLHKRYLSALSLPPGAIDLANDRPAEKKHLVGVAAMLVAREDLHPALIDLLLMASPRIVGQAGLFHDRGTFPSAQYLSLPLADEARRFHERGPSFLQSILPFWAATLIDRLIVMLVPLLALVLPLIRVFPPVYRWRVRSRIYRWYEDLRSLEARLDGDGVSSELTASILRLEQEVKQVETPLSYADELYHLRSHIELVKARVEEFA